MIGIFIVVIAVLVLILRVMENRLLKSEALRATAEARLSGLHEVPSRPPSNPDLLASVAEVNTEAQGSGFQHDLLPPSGYKYEVFLSFYGPDTRRGFSDCLYQALKGAGVKIFWTDESAPTAEDISSDTQPIAESKIFLPILSRNYASCERCLKELTFMLECKHKGKSMILPIFYDLSPTEAQDQTGDYDIALHQHEKKYGPEIVEQWKGALAEVGHLKGMDLAKSADG